MYIYNSLSRKKEEFVPLNPAQVKMYACGPTVYDEPHIGHARSAYIFDLVRRYLIYRGYEVTLVRNVTDVDDKIIEKAKEEFKNEDLKAAVEKVARKYLDSYHQAMVLLGIGKPDYEPKAAEYIPKIIEFIGQLVKNGCAYPAGGDVYFDIKKAKGYGKLSRQNLEKMEAGARVAAGEAKKDPFDFALWKAAKEDEPSWDSPWGRGRPGWHIECSAMSSDILGDEFDIHGGGLDLIFPHHENEIAQSEAAGKKFARYWMHHGLLTINGQKMSKSLGNFVTVRDFLEKYQDADILKLFFLSAHYSHPIDYTPEKIDEVTKQREVFKYFFDIANTSISPEGRMLPPISQKEQVQIDKCCHAFMEAMDNDFNTPQALSYLFELADFSSARETTFAYARSKLADLLGLFGLGLKAVSLSSEVSQKLRQRSAAKERKDYHEADEIRNELEQEYSLFISDTGVNSSITTINPFSRKGKNKRSDT
jgi:cysteinyl-tRNA synthetase